MERADRKRKGIIALGIVLACCPCASALNPSLDINQYAHDKWTAREGYFKGVIQTIAQTPDGYLWLGTEFGLVRFDGVRGVPWQPPPGEHLSGTNIRNLLAARDGSLWIGTETELVRWKDGKLAHFPEIAGHVQGILEDREGTVWVGVYSLPIGRLCAIRSGSVQCYGEDGKFGNQVLSLYEDRGANLWAWAVTGLWRWKPGPPKLYTAPGAALSDLLHD